MSSLAERPIVGGLLITAQGMSGQMVVFLRAVDAAEADALSFVIVQDCEHVTVEDGDDGSGEARREYDCEGGNEEA